MVLPVDLDSDDYKFFRTLNEDVKIKRVSDISSHWDIQFDNFDYVNVAGLESLNNAICIAIMTRLNELNSMSLYDGFGCRVHELVKANKSDMVRYKMELFVTEVLENMRRVLSVDQVTITDDDRHSYRIEFKVTSISNEIVTGSVVI